MSNKNILHHFTVQSKAIYSQTNLPHIRLWKIICSVDTVIKVLIHNVCDPEVVVSGVVAPDVILKRVFNIPPTSCFAMLFGQHIKPIKPIKHKSTQLQTAQSHYIR